MTDPALLDRVRTRLIAQTAAPSTADVARALREDGALLGADQLLAEAERVRADLAGAGPLEPWLRTPGVTDVLVTGPREVWVDRGRGVERVDVVFADEGEVRRLAQRLAASCRRRLDDAAPYVDGRLPDGTRLHAVLAPVAVGGTCISLRVPGRRAFTFDDLVARGAAPASLEPWIDALVSARLSVVVSGGTGTGKTTWLAMLLGRCDLRERIVVVEDSAELVPDHPHVVRLESRPPNIEGAGAVLLRDLVRQSLRMRPDRVVVGEVRGAEVVDMLTAFNTGHEGGMTSVHANSAADVPARLEALAATGGLDRAAAHAQMGAGLDVVLHLHRDRQGVRRWRSVSVARRDGGLVHLQDALVADGDGLRHGTGIGRLLERLGDHVGDASP